MILELILRTSRYSTMMRRLNWNATMTMTGMIRLTMAASCQSMMAMKNTAVAMLMMPQVTSSSPHVTSSARRSVSDVTRDMIQPTGVLL